MKGIGVFMIGLVFVSANLRADEIILYPCEDVCITTFGGGEGGNVFMKFDISGVPVADTIDSVFLKVYAWQVDSGLVGWDGDVDFWNVNSQIWDESTNIDTIWAIPTTDSILQNSGFGDTIGWTRSVDITPIFLRDYNSSHTYCSIKLKDPDDMTTRPMSFGLPFDDEDTLALGGDAAADYLYFYPHERLNSPPKLVVYYTKFGVGETDSRLQITDYKLEVCPNPGVPLTAISYHLPAESRVLLEIYDTAGRLVDRLVDEEKGAGSCEVRWDTRGVAGGVYFVKFEAGNYRATKKLTILK